MKRIVVDVREPFEFAWGHVDGALNIPLNEFSDPQVIDGLPRDAEIIVYCRSGNRSGMAMKILNGEGFDKVINGINQVQTERYLQK